MAVQGTYAGFRLIDISSPANPVEIINWEECASLFNSQGNQGDVIIWENLVIRSWNSPTPASGSQCGNWPMAQGEEGVHVIDISDPQNPEVVAFVDLLCGSHTETLVPDLDNDRLLIYSNSSAGTFLGSGEPPDQHQPNSCRGFDIVEVPLSDPASAAFVRFVPAGDPNANVETHHPCHDTSVILGDANLVACAGSGSVGNAEGPGVAVFTVDPALGGSKDNPRYLYYKVTGGISLGHSASFTWDGKYIVVGHEPGGGSGARCQETSNPLERTFFFVDAATGASAGQFTLPWAPHLEGQRQRRRGREEAATPQPADPARNVRVQGHGVRHWRQEGLRTRPCTTQSGDVGGGPFRVAPDVLRVGAEPPVRRRARQAGISAVDFSDPANPYEFAYADPAPLVNSTNPNAILLGGSWSAFFYSGRIYDSDIRRGLTIWNLRDPRVQFAKKLSHLNPRHDTAGGVAFGPPLPP